MDNLNPFDVFALIVLLLAGIRTAFRGFVAEFSTLAWLILGTTGGILFSGALAPLFEPWLGKGPLNQVLGFLVVFGLVFAIIAMAASSIRRMLESAELQSLDRGLGFVLGLLEGAILVFGVYFILDIQSVWPVHDQLGASVSGTLMRPLLPYAKSFISAQTGTGGS